MRTPMLRNNRLRDHDRGRGTSRRYVLSAWLMLWLVCGSLAAQPNLRERRIRMTGLDHRTWTVQGVDREGLVHIPDAARTTPTPVVFVFHGHGGTMAGASNSFRMHAHWPEAISVYPQGLNTPGRLTDPEGKRSGWQSQAGAQEDRDLLLFDAVLASLRGEFNVDDRRIYATGHSNGGGFTYLLWRKRGDQLAAVAPSSASGPGAQWSAQLAQLTPKPVLHLAGEQDPLVKYEWQQRTMEQLRKVNGCDPEGKPWAPQCTQYTSANGPPVVTCIHPGNHSFPREAPPLFVKFFQEHALPEPGPSQP